MRIFITLLTVLCLAAPAKADFDYSGSATLDWSALTLSGIPIQIGPPDGQGCTPNCIPGGIIQSQWAGLNQGTEEILEDRVHNTILRADTFPPPSGLIGSAISQIDGTHLMASIHATGLAGDIGSGTVGAGYRTDPSNDFRALGTGSLTITIPYLLAHAGVPTLSQGFDLHATASGALDLMNTTAQGAHTFSQDTATLLSPSGNGQQVGMLHVTQFFQAGDLGRFGVNASVFTEVKSVPIPDMLWPTVMGLIVLAWWMERRRGRANGQAEG